MIAFHGPPVTPLWLLHLQWELSDSSSEEAPDLVARL